MLLALRLRDFVFRGGGDGEAALAAFRAFLGGSSRTGASVMRDSGAALALLGRMWLPAVPWIALLISSTVGMSLDTLRGLARDAFTEGARDALRGITWVLEDSDFAEGARDTLRVAARGPTPEGARDSGSGRSAVAERALERDREAGAKEEAREAACSSFALGAFAAAIGAALGFAFTAFGGASRFSATCSSFDALVACAAAFVRRVSAAFACFSSFVWRPCLSCFSGLLPRRRASTSSLNSLIVFSPFSRASFSICSSARSAAAPACCSLFFRVPSAVEARPGRFPARTASIPASASPWGTAAGEAGLSACGSGVGGGTSGAVGAAWGA